MEIKGVFFLPDFSLFMRKDSFSHLLTYCKPIVDSIVKRINNLIANN